MKVIPETRRVY